MDGYKANEIWKQFGGERLLNVESKSHAEIELIFDNHKKLIVMTESGCELLSQIEEAK